MTLVNPSVSCPNGFLSKLPNKPKLIQCNRNISGVGGGEALIPVEECFIQLQTGRKTFRDRVIVIENLKGITTF